MKEWISVKDRLPEISGRYLVMTKCTSESHLASSKNWSYPCCSINICYFRIWDKKLWCYSSDDPLQNNVNVTYWMPLHEPPEIK